MTSSRRVALGCGALLFGLGGCASNAAKSSASSGEGSGSSSTSSNSGNSGSGNSQGNGSGTSGGGGSGSNGSGGNSGSNGSGGSGSASGSGGSGGSGTEKGDATAGSGSTSGGSDGGPTSGPGLVFSAACQAQTNMLVGAMSLAEKAGQMVMAAAPVSTSDITTYAPGAVFVAAGVSPSGGSGGNVASWEATVAQDFAASLKGPHGIPILYGLDAVHGNSGSTGTVIFPHNAGLASSRDAALVQQAEAVAAMESMAAGVTWTFSPFAGTTWAYQWGRVYESFSDDPTWTGEMLTAAVKGLQGANGLGTGSPGVVACSKHFAGDGQTSPGTSRKGGVVDRGNAEITLAQMEQWGMAQYIPAINAGLGCIMVSDAQWTIPGSPATSAAGADMTSNQQLLTTLLKGMYGFKGFVVTDYNAATDLALGIPASINAGVDMLMEPEEPINAGPTSAINEIVSGVNGGKIPQSRIDDAVSRILNVKCQYGLWNYKYDASWAAAVGGTANRAVGRKAVAESLVVLQNNNSALPLSKTAKIWVGGTGANALHNQCGGWTIQWQGTGDTDALGTMGGTTIFQGIQGSDANASMDMSTLAGADVAVVVLSESLPGGNACPAGSPGATAYAEFEGDCSTINTLAPSDFALLTQAKAMAKKVVAVVVSGRPVLITDQLANADAWVAAWLPGTEGGGVADILFGDVKPTGKLSHSWPTLDVSTPGAQTNQDTGYKALFAVGFGLTY